MTLFNPTHSQHPNEQAATKLPRELVWAILAICALPLLLSLLGVDFGTQSTPISHAWALTADRYEVIDNTFVSLKGAFTHTLLEWSAFCVAIFVVYLSFSQYKVTHDVTTPIIGVAFFMAGCMDAFHTLAADRLIPAVADNRDLIPFTWAICRLFNALIMIVGVAILLWRPIQTNKKTGIGFVMGISLLFGIIAYGIIHLSATATNLPQTTFPNALFTRPYDVIPLVLFVIGGLLVYPLLYKRVPSLFAYALVISAVPEAVSEAHMAFGSTALFDSHFNIGHFMKVIAYSVPLMGLMLDYIHTQKALKLSEVRQRAILDNVADGIITINGQGIVQSFNPAAETIFGYQSKEVTGKNIRMLMPDPYHHEHDAYLQHYTQTGQRQIIGIGREVEGQRKDGSLFPMDLAVNEMWIDDQRLFSGIIRDITERKRAEKIKSEFISTVSHELRTPLTSIRGSLGLLSGGVAGELSEQASKLLEIANQNTERLLALINDLLDMEKMTTGNISFQFKNMAIMPFIVESVKINQNFAEQHRVRFEIIKAISDDHCVHGDSHRLAQVMSNLLSNAAKFSPPDEVVEINVSRKQGTIRISVTDHGHGIPEDFRDLVFDKFTQSDSSDTRKVGGTGLGLSISRAIMEKHGGRIDFVTQTGKGTSFYIELLEILYEERITKVSRPRSPKTDLAAHILVVEDDPDVATLLRMTLVESGYNVDIAYTASQAKQLLAENQYNSITLDIMLPDQNGISFLREMQSNPSTKNLPVVVVSAVADTAKHQLDGGAVGIVAWLEKPINVDKLLAAVQQSIRDKALPRVLHVEDDPDVHEFIKVLLKDRAELVWVTHLAAAKKILKDTNFDLLLLDIGLPDGSGLELLDIIKQSVPPISTVVFSANELDYEISQQVSAALVKSSTSNEQLLNAIISLLPETDVPGQGIITQS